MVHSLCDKLNLTSKGERVAVLINGFGATPLMELYLLNASVARELANKGITIARTFVGNYMTSIDMAGASISLLKLDEEMEDLLNAPSAAPAFIVNGPTSPVEFYEPYANSGTEQEVNFNIETPQCYSVIGSTLTLENMKYIVDVMSDSIIRNEVPFCELDAHAGDGDFGMSVAKGFRQ